MLKHAPPSCNLQGKKNTFLWATKHSPQHNTTQHNTTISSFTHSLSCSPHTLSHSSSLPISPKPLSLSLTHKFTFTIHILQPNTKCREKERERTKKEQRIPINGTILKSRVFPLVLFPLKIEEKKKKKKKGGGDDEAVVGWTRYDERVLVEVRAMCVWFCFNWPHGHCNWFL